MNPPSPQPNQPPALQIFTAMHFSGPVAAIYFVILNLVGTYIILNLFIAILLSNFDSIEAVDPGSVDPKVRRLTMMVRVRRWLWCFRFFPLHIGLTP